MGEEKTEDERGFPVVVLGADGAVSASMLDPEVALSAMTYAKVHPPAVAAGVSFTRGGLRMAGILHLVQRSS